MLSFYFTQKREQNKKDEFTLSVVEGLLSLTRLLNTSTGNSYEAPSGRPLLQNVREKQPYELTLKTSYIQIILPIKISCVVAYRTIFYTFIL